MIEPIESAENRDMTNEPPNLVTLVHHAMLVASMIAAAALNLSDPNVANGQTQPMRPRESNAADLVVKMQSDRFSDRQRAMNQLLATPDKAIPLLQESIESADRDFRLRALKILERLAMGNNAQSELAFNALRHISLSDDVGLSHKAQTASYEVLLYQQYSAARQLERLNAHIEYSSHRDDQRYPLADHLRIGDDWRGRPEDLRQILTLFGLSSLDLSHRQIGDDLLLNVDAIFMLSRIKLKRCSITDQTIASLARLSSLSELEVMYCPIGTDCFESLAQFSSLTSIRLIGTNVDPACADLLEQKLNVTTDIRRGAFLGIRYSPVESSCRLTSIVPGSSADNAGFQIGDEIVEFNQQPIQGHRELTKLLREILPGQRATVKVERASALIEIPVVMGEWN
jgi:hypothetical protein